MPNAQLSWSQAAVLGAVLLAVALVLARVGERRARRLAPVVHEVAVITGLYALWQLVGALAQHGTTGAFARGRWIEHTQRAWRLPSERDLQQPLLDHPWLGWAANVYYATMHFGALFALLAWVFWLHRPQYKRVRALVVGFTGLSLLIQLVPVAPPRLMPELGFTDVAVRYGQSVYGLGGISTDELSAMPSVHVGWAVLVAVVVVWLGRGRWRAVGPAHAAVTIWVVAATGNHWWLDGIVAIALLAVVGVAQWVWRGARERPVPVAPTAAVEVPV